MVVMVAQVLVGKQVTIASRSLYGLIDVGNGVYGRLELVSMSEGKPSGGGA